jgi:hypothetical protein
MIKNFIIFTLIILTKLLVFIEHGRFVTVHKGQLLSPAILGHTNAFHILTPLSHFPMLSMFKGISSSMFCVTFCYMLDFHGSGLLVSNLQYE